MVASNLVISQQPYFDPTAYEKYKNLEGTKDFYWQNFNANAPSPATYNATRANVVFTTSLSDSYYLLENAKLLIQLQVGQSSGSNPAAGTVSAFPTTSNVAFNPDSLFSNVNLQINGTELADPTAKQNYNYLATHLMKCLSYSPQYAKQVSESEFFFVDNNVDGSANINPLVSNCTVGQVTPLSGGVGGATTPSNVIFVGNTSTGAAVGTAVDALQSTTADGNTNLFFRPNQYFNSSFWRRAQMSNNGANISFEVPLYYIYPAVLSMRGLKTGYNLQLSLYMNSPTMMIFSASGESAGTVIIQNMNLQIPCFTVNPSYSAKLLSRNLNSEIELNYYTDVQVYQTPILYTPGSGLVSPTWNGILKRKPLAMMFLMQYASENNSFSGNQQGNIFRCFNFQPISDQAVIGNSQQIPKTLRTSYGSQGGYQVLYRDYLKMMDIWRSHGVAMIDYATYTTTKFFLSYDCRDMPDHMFTANSYPCDVSLSINLSNNGIAAANTNAGLTGTFPGGNAYGYLVVFFRNSTRVKYSPNGLSIDGNVGSF